MLRWMLLFSVFAFAASSPAWAYPLNPYQVIWPFEGHGAAAGGGPQHSFTGQLEFSDPSLAPTLTWTLYADGDPTPSTGFVDLSLVDGEAGVSSDFLSGQGGGIYDVSPPLVAGLLRIGLQDYDGVALDSSSVDPAGFLLPPSYAPDIGSFESQSFVFYAEECFDVPPLDSFCSNGGGSRYQIDLFDITIDRFVDPVPEPASVVLGALALLISTQRVATRR